MAFSRFASVSPNNQRGLSYIDPSGFMNSSVLTIAELRAANLSVNFAYIMDAGKQGVFMLDNGDASTTDNGAYTIVSSNGKRYKRVQDSFSRFEWTDAKGDGVADDTAAFVAAFNTGARVFQLTPGRNYKISSLTLPDNVIIDGRGATITQARVSGDAAPVFVLGNNNTLQNIAIVCDPHANDSGSENGAIKAQSKTGIRVTGCYIKNHSLYGIDLKQCKRVTIADNRFWTSFVHSSMINTSGAWTDSSDIRIYSSTGLGEDFIIANNRCNSPFTSQGIWVNGVGYDKSMIIYANNCTTTDETGNLWTGTNWYAVNQTGAMVRRHGIQCAYSSQSTSGVIKIVNNICTQTLVSGVYLSGGGLGKGVSASGNWCESNGYLNNSLSGGIVVTGGIGGDVILDNYVVDFKGTGPLCGAITISVNPGTITPNSPTFEGNTILNSAGHGYYIYGAPSELTITGGIVKGSALSDIYMETNTGVATTTAPVVFDGIRLVRTNATASSMFLDNYGGTRRYVIKSCVFNGFGTTPNTDANSAVVFKQPNTLFSITDCDFENYSKAITSLFYYKGRNPAHVINNNRFKNLAFAFGLLSDYSYLGFICGVGNTFESVGAINPVSYFPVFHQGFFNQFQNVTIYAAEVPTAGTWIRGDRILNLTPTAGGVEGWVCVASGTLGTLTATGSITNGGTVLTVNTVVQIGVGQFLTIAGVTGVKRVVSVSGTSLTLDSAADATVTNVAVNYSAATLKAFGNIAS